MRIRILNTGVNNTSDVSKDMAKFYTVFLYFDMVPQEFDSAATMTPYEFDSEVSTTLQISTLLCQLHLRV
jgi:hypothetical protein